MTDEREQDKQWERIDDHEGRLQQLDRELAIVNRRFLDLEGRFDRQRDTMIRNRELAHAEHQEQMKAIREIQDAVNQVKGGWRFGRWMFSIAAAIAAAWGAVRVADWSSAAQHIGSIFK